MIGKKLSGFSRSLRELVAGFLVYIAATSFPLHASDHTERLYADPPIGIAVYEFPPRLTFKDGKPTGLFIDITEEIMAEAKMPYVFVRVPVGRLYANLRERSDVVHVWPGMVSAHFLEVGLQIEPTLFDLTRLSLYGLKGNKPPAFGALQNVTLITMTGYKFGALLQSLETRNANVTVLSTPSHISGFRMLQAGRAPYVLDYQDPAGVTLKKLQMYDLEVTSVKEWQTALWVSKKAPQAEALRKVLAEASKRIVARRGKDPGATQN
ncbi:MAG: hypothetical protein JKY60_15070 [Kordiimonadaceae bacterium]|nr:hypothetical protein [Kordiimonadaceae bacterium]